MKEENTATCRISEQLSTPESKPNTLNDMDCGYLTSKDDIAGLGSCALKITETSKTNEIWCVLHRMYDFLYRKNL